MKIVKETKLHYQKGTSNKVYNVYLVEVSSDSYLVNFEYGRAGGNLKEGTKTTLVVDLTKAQKLFDSLVNSKIKKEYKVEAGFNSATGKEKKERDTISSTEYKKIILEQLIRAGELKNSRVGRVDNYEVSRLIYRAGELKIEGAKEQIVRIYELNSKEDNAFYYSVAWALGRYKDSSLRGIFNSLRDKLKESSRYIVEEALLGLNEPQEISQIESLVLPMPYRASLQNRDNVNFINQIQLLSEMIDLKLQTYKEAEENWDRRLRESIKKELMPLLSQVDEVYLKLYMLSINDMSKHNLMVQIIKFLPISHFNFSLFRRLYKMAEFREDQAILAELISKIESKKMACYRSYDYNKGEYRLTLGCSRIYFKKRSLRYLNTLSTHNPMAYLEFAKKILLSMNVYSKEFKEFSTEWYDNNWNRKVKKYDAFATHVTFMSILYGAGKRYMLLPSKKMWETSNSTIQNEYRPERNKELWDKHPKVALEILSKSTIAEVQKFAFTIVQEHPEVIKTAPLEMLLPMLNSHYHKARKLFFELLKIRYQEKKESDIAIAFLLSSDEKISTYGVEQISENIDILYSKDLMFKLMVRTPDNSFNMLLTLLEKLDRPKIILDYSIPKAYNSIYITTPYYANRLFLILKALSKGFSMEHLEILMRGDELNDAHILASKIIRDPAFSNLEIALEIKEKIAKFDNPEMLATTLYLLGKLSNQELMNAYTMLISFLYHQEVIVHQEAKKIIVALAEEPKNAEILLKAIVEKSFKSATDEVAKNVENSIKMLSMAYLSIDVDQLYRMLTAKSKLALRLGSLILTHYKASDFSVVQWARLAKNPNKSIRVWAYNAYKENPQKVKEAMPKSLMIFDTHWEDTRVFASEYFENFGLNSDEVVIVADSNHNDVQLFAKKMIEQGDYDREVILTKLSQHPALTIQKFVTDLMLAGMSDEQLLKMEYFFNTLLHSVNQNRVAKTRVMALLKSRLENEKVAKMVAKLASHHSASMVWADKELFVEMLSELDEKYDFELPLSQVEVEKREVV